MSAQYILSNPGKVNEVEYNRPSSNERILRVVKIFLKLIRRQPCASASLAHEFGVAARTIKRDIDLLRDIPIPVEYDAHKKTYYINGNGMFSMDKCTPVETMLLIMGLSVLQKIPLEIDMVSVDSLKCRLLYTLSQKERESLKAEYHRIDEVFITLLRLRSTDDFSSTIWTGEKDVKAKLKKKKEAQ